MMKSLAITLLTLVVPWVFLQQASMASSPTLVPSSDKTISLPDPNRPYFDMWGNKFDYMGNLIYIGNCPYIDPISNEPNPYCPDNPTLVVSDNNFAGK